MNKSHVKAGLIVLFFISMLVLPVMGETLQLEGLTKVASNNCGNNNDQPNLTMGSSWTYPVTAIAETVVARDASARTVVHGTNLIFSFEGLKADQTYVLAMSFLSDDATRVQSVHAGDDVLEEKLALPLAKVVKRTYKLAPSLYADGKVQVTIKKIAGANAVISTLDVYSSDPTPLKETGISTDTILEGIGLSLPSVGSKGEAVDSLSLNGTWQFNPAPPAEFWNGKWAKFGDIEVPGEWVMQGYEVVANRAAGYLRRFDVPKGWDGKQVKLRFDAVFSIAVVYVNGIEIGKHEGGFTVFEFDVTGAVKFGAENTIALSVTSESLSDTMASASKYAVHPLGGIARKVTLFAVSPVNVKSYHVTTEFDEAFDDATMNIEMKFNNQSDEELRGAKLKFSLMQWPTRKPVKLKNKQFDLARISAGQMLNETVEIAVDSPDKWDNEHPNLYVLQCQLVKGFKTIQTVERRFGFRQVDVRGNQVFVNNMPVKLRASNRHEAHPLRGRSLTMEQWRADVELFRDANCNMIRTSHYPPAEEFIAVCDELGMFVELETGICWLTSWGYTLKADEFIRATNLICQQMVEGVERDKSHPSVLIWSLGNESAWNSYFQSSYELAKKYDSSRPFTFHDQAATAQTNVVNFHYPGPNGAKNFASYKKPVWFGEYCHLNAYNRYELWTDPGLRDAWGRGFKTMWDEMYDTQSILGGALWSGIDDTFHLPTGHTVGYGTWGPIDGWRRRKPEHYHAKKVYSPVRITADFIETPETGTTITIPLENRHNFSNISELDISWQIESKKGNATADIAPGENGQMTIDTNVFDLEGKTVALKFNSPLGFVVDEYLLQIGKPAPLKKAISRASGGKFNVQSDDKLITIIASQLVVKFDKQTGMIVDASKDGNRILSAGPELMVLALNSGGDTQMTKPMMPVTSDTVVRSGRKLEGVSVLKKNNSAVITVTDSYDIAKGGYKLTIESNGTMTIDYEYEMIAGINPRQYGMVMTYPGSFQKLHWQRKGMWTVYPEDHIARNQGVADAFVGVGFSGTAGPVAKPNYPWRHDTNELGTNDFRSTKENIISAYLSDSKTEDLVLQSDGKQHIRCWVEGDVTRMLISEYNNPGSERFYRGHAAVEDKPLKQTGKVSGSIRFTVIEN